MSLYVVRSCIPSTNTMVLGTLYKKSTNIVKVTTCLMQMH